MYNAVSGTVHTCRRVDVASMILGGLFHTLAYKPLCVDLFSLAVGHVLPISMRKAAAASRMHVATLDGFMPQPGPEGLQY